MCRQHWPTLARERRENERAAVGVGVGKSARQGWCSYNIWYFCEIPSRFNILLLTSGTLLPLSISVLEFYWPRFLRIVRCLPAPLLFCSFFLLSCCCCLLASLLPLRADLGLDSEYKCAHKRRRDVKQAMDRRGAEGTWIASTCQASEVDVYIGKYFKYLSCGGVVVFVYFLVCCLPYNWNFY